MRVSKQDRTSKKRRYTTPGGKHRIEYHKRKNATVKCRNCGSNLNGVPGKLKGKSKSEKVPNRPFAGVYCSKCTRKIIKHRVRVKIKELEEMKE